MMENCILFSFSGKPLGHPKGPYGWVQGWRGLPPPTRKSLPSPISGTAKLKDSWSFLPRNTPWGKLGILHILAISCSDSHTCSWAHGYNFTNAHTHTHLVDLFFVYILSLHLCRQDDKSMCLICLICLPKQETIHHQCCNVHAQAHALVYAHTHTLLTDYQWRC